MALQLDEDYKGATANYWRINFFTYDDIKDTAVVHLWLYLDLDSRNADLANNGLKREVLTLKNVKSETLQSVDPVSARDALKMLLYSKIMESKLDAEGNELNKFALGTMV
jgi:hypothetical protein